MQAVHRETLSYDGRHKAIMNARPGAVVYGDDYPSGTFEVRGPSAQASVSMNRKRTPAAAVPSG